MCKLQSYESAPRDAVTHRHTCKSQSLLCFLLVVQELRDVLKLLLERARLRAQCAAPGLSCCGPQPEADTWLQPTAAHGLQSGRKQQQSVRIFPSAFQSWAVNAHGKRRAGIRASAKPCVHSKSPSQDTGLHFHRNKQQVQEKPDMQLYTKFTRNGFSIYLWNNWQIFTWLFFFFYTGESWRYFTGASISQNRKFAQEITVMLRDKSDNITNLFLFSNNYVRVRISPLDKKIYFLFSSLARNALLINPINSVRS